MERKWKETMKHERFHYADMQAVEGCDSDSAGAPDELTRDRYISYAESGAGLIWMEPEEKRFCAQDRDAGHTLRQIFQA